MRFRDLHAILVSAIMLAMAANAQGATFNRDSPAASFTTYQNHTVTFAAWGSDLGENEEWDRAEWFIDGWLVEDTTAMSGKTDYVSWTKRFDTQGVYEIKFSKKEYENEDETNARNKVCRMPADCSVFNGMCRPDCKRRLRSGCPCQSWFNRQQCI